MLSKSLGPYTALLAVLCLLGVLASSTTATVAWPSQLLDERTKTSVSSAPSPGLERLVANYGNLPLSFEPVQGGNAIRFLARGQGYALALSAAEATFKLHSQGADASGPRPVAKDPAAIPTVVDSKTRLQLVGADPAAAVVGLEQLPGVTNYFLGSDPSRWRTNIRTFAKVKVAKAWPGVDLVYYGNQRQLEVDFVVAPGADPEVIALRMSGVEHPMLSTEGDLLMGTSGVRLSRPSIYQEVDGARQPVEGGYLLGDDGLVHFWVAAYDATQSLVIDPVLIYSTYLGGSDDDLGNAIAVDAAGNAYVTGSTRALDFPVLNPFWPANPNLPATWAFVTKLNANGSGLVYSSYLGGDWPPTPNRQNSGQGIAVDASGSAYVVGSTDGKNFPAINALYPDKGQEELDSGFVVRLNPAGNSLEFSTYLGSVYYNSDDGDTIAKGVALDSSGNVHITGYTADKHFPLLNPIQGSQRGVYDAFVTKINSTGRPLLFSTYLGGSDLDQGMDVAVDTAGGVYVTGVTASSNFPTSPTAFQSTLHNPGDAFVTKLSTSGSLVAYSTFLGGNGHEWATDITVDAAGNAFVTGVTASSDFPMPADPNGALFRNLQAFRDGFFAKLSASGSALLYATYLGGSTGSTSAEGIALDASGKVWISGVTAATNFPTTANAYLPTCDGIDCLFLTCLDVSLNRLDYSTYFRGGGKELAADSRGNIYVTGRTYSATFDTTIGAFDRTFGGGACTNSSGTPRPCSDAVVFKFGPPTPTSTPTATPTRSTTPTRTPTPTITPTPRPPIVESIAPASAGQGVNMDVTIYGYFFQPGASVTIGERPLRKVVFLGAETAVPHRWRLKGTLPGGAIPGSYDVIVVNPDGRAGTLSNGFIVRSDYERGLGPSTVSYGSYTWSGVGSHNYPVLTTCEGAASITVEQPIYGDPPTSVVLVDNEGQALAALSRVAEIEGGGLYRGTANLGRAGGLWSVTIHGVALWTDGFSRRETVFGLRSICVDPSGRIYDATTAASVAGALVTLMARDPAGDVIWNAATSGQLNPQSSSAQGRYGWNTTPGDFYVLVSKPCYADVQSRVVTVPPPVNDLDVGLTPRDCTPVQMATALATDADGYPVDLLSPGAPLHLLATISNSVAAETSLAADYRLEVRDARGQVVSELTQTGSVQLTPGLNTLELSGTAPGNSEGEYTFAAWVTFDQQTTFRGYRFRVGVERAQVRLYLPLLQRNASGTSAATATRTSTSTPTPPVTTTPTATLTATPSPSATPVASSTSTPSRTPTPTFAHTATPTPTVTPTPTIPSGWQIIYSDGFEGSFPGPWQRFGNPSWGQTNCKADAGSYSVWPAADGTGAVVPCVNNYPDNLDAWLIYGPFSLQDATAAEVTFRCWSRSEEGYDSLSWLASTDGQHFYGFMDSGDTGGWVNETFDLSDVYILGDLRGQPQVWIAFLFQSDPDTNDSGPFLDEVMIRKRMGGGVMSPPHGGGTGRTPAYAERP